MNEPLLVLNCCLDSDPNKGVHILTEAGRISTSAYEPLECRILRCPPFHAAQMCGRIGSLLPDLDQM